MSEKVNEVGQVISSRDSGAIPTLDAKPDDKVLGAPTSKNKSKTNVGKLFILLAFLAGFLFLVFGALWFAKSRHAAKEAVAVPKFELKKPGFAEKNEAVESASIESTKAALMAKQKEDDRIATENAAKAAAAADKAKAEQGGAKFGPAPAAAPATAGQPGGPNAPKPPKTPLERKLGGSVLVDFSGEKAVQATNNSGSGAAAPADLSNAGFSNPGAARAPNANADSISARLQPTVLESRFAGTLPNLDYLLKRGTTIPCALKTGIDTTLPGFIICNVISDVYSANRKTLLVERGATLLGEQQSSLKQGQERTFVVWTRLDNPSGVFANLDSPGTDQMGFNGIPGYVDTHFSSRFGGAIMLSFIKDFSQNLSARQGSSTNSGPTYNNSSQAGQDMAAEALRNSINIPPTLVVNPGTIVYVLVARDVSFESVYTLAK